MSLEDTGMVAENLSRVWPCASHLSLQMFTQDRQTLACVTTRLVLTAPEASGVKYEPK
jgi:hypothetical protein